MSSKASRAAYKRCPETCQKVRAEIGEAIERILEAEIENCPSLLVSRLTDAAFDVAYQYGTDKIRSALIECEEELEETRSVLDTTESDLKDAQSTADALRDEVAELEKQVEKLESELDSAQSEVQSSRL